MPALLELLPQDNIIVKKVASTHGGEYQGPCPVCGGQDRFHVWPEEGDGGTWWCRGCERGGDVIQYLRDVRKLPYLEACHAAGQEPAPSRRSFDWNPANHGRKWEPREVQPPPEEWSRKCGAFIDWAHEQLLGMPKIASYMHSKRGLSEETIKTFRLGYNPQNLTRERDFWGLPEKIKDDGTKQEIWLPQGIVIPYFVDGILQRARIRRLNIQGGDTKAGPPYCVVSGSSSEAMLLPRYTSDKKLIKVIVVVESELDGLLLWQELNGIASVIAMGSASARPDKQAASILRAADLILVALDNDDQGDKNTGAEQSQWWINHFPHARRLPPVDGKDPGEMWQNRVDLSQWVTIGVNKYFTRVQHVTPPEAGHIWDFEILFEEADKKYRQVAAAYPEGCGAWIAEHRPDIAAAEQADFDWIDEVWKLCMLGKASLDDFRAAIDIWVDGWMEAINAYKEAMNG